jgi:predicted peptidase
MTVSFKHAHSCATACWQAVRNSRLTSKPWHTRLLLLCVLAILPSIAASAEPTAARQVATKFSGRVDAQIDYLLYLPADYEKQESWPLLIFLHGSGERGDDLKLVKTHGPPKMIEAGHKFPFIVVSPQCPKYQRWQPIVLDGMLDNLIKQLRVDKSRIYLTGLSMGGQGTWAWAANSPQRFAAIAPVCGRADRSWGEVLTNMPTWVFHGAKDTAVPLTESEKVVNALKKNGGSPKFTIYPEAGHDSWTVTYENPELYKWLLKHKRE